MSALLREDRGTSILEFALAAPVLMTMLIGISQLGLGFYAQSRLKHAVAEGARFATTFPRPGNAAVVTEINTRSGGLDTANVTGPTVTDCTASGYDCVDISMSYRVQFRFLFFTTPAVTLTENRRVFVNPSS